MFLFFLWVLQPKFGEKIVIQNVQGDLRAEDIVRAIAVASDNMVGVADHAPYGKSYQTVSDS